MARGSSLGLPENLGKKGLRVAKVAATIELTLLEGIPSVRTILFDRRN
jgi:hypothetical protein